MNQIVEMPERELQAPRSQIDATPSYLLQLAVEQGADIDKLEKLMALQERWEANQARKAYTEAMAHFKANAPEINKDKVVSFTGTTYSHATLGNIAEIVIPALAKHGLTHRWDTVQPGNGLIIVSCILTHLLGHSEKTTLEALPDNSGKKNSIQQIASTVTYLQRYTLLAACGLSTKDIPDDDGHGASAQANKEPPAKAAINAERFAAALDAVRTKGYAAAKVRSGFILTLDQETALSDAEKEAK